MKKPISPLKGSPKAPGEGNGSRSPGPFIEDGPVAAEAGLPSSRQDVRQQTARVNVPRQSERPVERSKQRRSRRP